MNISPKKLAHSLNEATEGTIIREGRLIVPCDSCTVVAGFVETPDGRKAQVQIIVQADEDEWQIE